MIVRSSIREDFKNMPSKTIEQVRDDFDKNYVGKVFVLKAISFMNRIAAMVRVKSVEIRDEKPQGYKKIPLVWVQVENMLTYKDTWHPAESWDIITLEQFTSTYTIASDDDKKNLEILIKDLTKAKEVLDNQ